MRHLFDQYSKPENRLTHALVSGLANDPRLLRKFIQWITGKRPAKTTFHIIEQSLPGEIEPNEEKAEDRGLPDAWIYSDEGWSLLIESKVASRISVGQLNRHLYTAKRRGFSDTILLVLATTNNLKRLPAGVVGKAWHEVYEWLSIQSGASYWARQILTYMEVAEGSMVRSSYLKEGKLTRFTGIPFNRDNQFNYFEAKRVLELLMDELKRNKSIQKLGVDPSLPGRGAIKGYKGSGVWDCMRIGVSKNIKNFTKYPHLTIFLGAEKSIALITLPNAVERSIRKRIFGHGHKVFNELIFSIARNMRNIIKLDPSVQPYAKVVQRHWTSQSSPAIEDAILRYDLRTVATDGRVKPQKLQPEWLETTYTVMASKRANIQFEIGVEFPYIGSKVINTPKALELFEQSFVALKPFIDMALSD